jgi:Flp pilus assembly protein TadG
MKQGTHVRAGNNMDIDPVDGAPAPGPTAPIPPRRRPGARRSAARGRRGRRDRGASIVEFAIIMPLLFALVLGIIDFGNTYNDWISVRQGAREGARQAVVGNAATSDSCSLTGDAASANELTRRAICLVKDRVGLNDQDVRVALRFEGGEHEVERSMAVCVAYPARSVTGFYSALLDGRQVVLTTRVQMRVERLYGPGGDLTLKNTQEAHPYGDGWAWCVAHNTG